MEFFKIRHDIPFMRHALAFNVVSLITFLLAVFFLATKGLNFSIEFTGGTVIEINYEHAADVERVRKVLDARGYNDYSVQNFGSSRDILIRMPLKPGQNNADLSKAVMEGLTTDDKTAKLQRVEFVGPQVGEELAWNGALALLVTSIGIVLYLALRFEWKFGVAAIIANLHDVVIILGFFALFQWEFSLPVLAAVLAVLGYSVNESVVIADRSSTMRSPAPSRAPSSPTAAPRPWCPRCWCSAGRRCITSRSPSPSASVSGSTLRCWSWRRWCAGWACSARTW